MVLLRLAEKFTEAEGDDKLALVIGKSMHFSELPIDAAAPNYCEAEIALVGLLSDQHGLNLVLLRGLMSLLIEMPQQLFEQTVNMPRG